MFLRSWKLGGGQRADTLEKPLLLLPCWQVNKSPQPKQSASDAAELLKVQVYTHAHTRTHRPANPDATLNTPLKSLR